MLQYHSQLEEMAARRSGTCMYNITYRNYSKDGGKIVTLRVLSSALGLKSNLWGHAHVSVFDFISQCQLSVWFIVQVCLIEMYAH